MKEKVSKETMQARQIENKEKIIRDLKDQVTKLKSQTIASTFKSKKAGDINTDLETVKEPQVKQET